MNRFLGGLATARVTGVLGWAVITVTFAVDQITKQLALALLSPGNVQPVMPFFNLRLGFNEGVSFGMFAQVFAGRPFALAGITLAIIALLTFLLVRSCTRWEAVALGAMIGGALGNVCDRLRIGAVVDFLDFHLWDYRWPAFNLADTAIVVGVAILILANFAGPHASSVSPDRDNG
jgi:signal peptidase II